MSEDGTAEIVPGYWYPNPERGLHLCGVGFDEWAEIRDSSEAALLKLCSDLWGNGDPVGMILKSIEWNGVTAASEHIEGALPHFLKSGDAAFFERLAAAIRKSREGKKRGVEDVFPVGGMHDTGSAILIRCWTQSPFPHLDVPPFSLWSYDALADFVDELHDRSELLSKLPYGREGIRRRIEAFNLKPASVVVVKKFLPSVDWKSFQLEQGVRSRPVAWRKKVSRGSSSGDTI